MFKKIFSRQSQSITGAAILLGAASFASRLIGLARDHLLAKQFGAGHILDAYYAAFRIPDFIFNIVIIGALSAGIIPLLAKALNKSKEDGWMLVNTLLGVVSAATVSFGVAAFIAAPIIIRILVPGFSPEMQATTVELTRIMFLSPILLGLSSIVGSVLQSYKNFFIFSLAPIMYNLGIIFGALFLVPIIGIHGLAAGVVIGAALHLGIQIPTLLQHGYRFRPNIDWRHPGIKSLSLMMVPRILDLAAAEINFMIITAFASTLGPGRIAMFQYANNLQTFPVSFIGISFAIATFPVLASLVTQKNWHELQTRIATTAQQILFFIVPFMIAFLLLRAQIVRVVLGSGAFDWTATINTANILGFFALSLFAQALIPLLVRAFFAFEDTWTPFFTSVTSVIVNIVAALMLKDSLGVAGLGLAFSLSMVVECALLWILLRRKVGTLHDLRVVKTLYKISIAAIVMAVAMQSLKAPIAAIVNMNTYVGIGTQGLVVGGTGLILYFGIAYILRVEAMQLLVASFTRRWIKTEAVPIEAVKTEER